MKLGRKTVANLECPRCLNTVFSRQNTLNIPNSRIKVCAEHTEESEECLQDVN